MTTDWKVPADEQPQAGDFAFDLDRTLSSVVAVTSRVPEDAFTAETLGSERAGNGVVIREDGLVLTIGYLITEAEEVWLTTNTGQVAPGHVVAYDQTTGLGLVQTLGRLNAPAMPLGDSRKLATGDRVVVAGAGGRTKAVSAHVVGLQEFAGYWEYVLDKAVFTAPAHPHWGGAAMIGEDGALLGVGSLQVQHPIGRGRVAPLNMVVPIELLPPILDDMLQLGRPSAPPRPWLGLYAAETDERIVLLGVAGDGPARRAGLNEGDAVLAVAGKPVKDLATFFRQVWALGPAGVDVPLTLDREGDVFDVTLKSADRQRYLKSARLH
ncbi:serine protease [Alsobacter metallidurans]|uniref:Serine protease n=1 Tax=Alsobacter metallidurans TaxID=340221 RepID=A0A917I2P1_9HYPH|nr:S1C family serine protease [Alsobacter metallidurans]GGH07346.1 serine protease [Alsobacter metallidurans]